MEAEDPPEAPVDAWRESVQQHVRDYLWNGEEPVPPNLCDDLMRCLLGQCPELPLSYSFTSVYQLISLQRAPCVSLLGWSTDSFHTWSQEGKSHLQDAPLAKDKLLPRARLLLAGYIVEQTPDSSSSYDGNLYFKDKSGCLPCQISHLDLSLLGTLVLFPCWSYIPSPNGSSPGGYLEVLASPLPVIPFPLNEDSCDPAALTPTRALSLLNDRSHLKTLQVSVYGELSSVTSLVKIRQKVFFSFTLEDSESRVPVIVQVPSKLSWYHTLRTGEGYKVTSLTSHSLRGSTQRVFAVTDSSKLLSCPLHTRPLLSTSSEEQAPASDVKIENEAPVKSRARVDRTRLAKTLTYTGVLTRVLDPHAGLYELDRKVLLCTAYLQLLNGGRGLRAGAKVEISHAHLQQSPSPLYPTLVLSCCLRSRLTILEFSRLCSPLSATFSASSLHLHLLFRYQLTLPEYLWTSFIVDQLREKLCPRYVKRCCLSGRFGSGVQGVAHSLLHQTLSSFSEPEERNERDLQKEILGDPHVCPLLRYSPLSPPWSVLTFSKLLSLASDSRYLQTQESVSSLHWSCYLAQDKDLLMQPVLVGVLHASSLGSLKLKDQTSSLSCLVLPRAPLAWIGCVLEVRQYQMITEKICNGGERKDQQQHKTYALFLARDVRLLHFHDRCPTCPPSAFSTSPVSKKPRMLGPWASRHVLVKEVEGLLSNPDHDGKLQFQARASWVGSPELLSGQKSDGDETKLELLPKVVLIFLGSSVRWHQFINTGRVYRLVANGETDPGIFDSLAKQTKYTAHSPVCLTIPCDWSFEDVETSESSLQNVVSVEEALKMGPSASLLNVTGVLSQRSLCDPQDWRGVSSKSHVPGSFFPRGVSLKVSLCEQASHACVSVYLDVSLSPYPLGLLPGASVLLQGLERKVSRSGNVYLRSVPITCVKVLGPPTDNWQQIASPPLVTFSHLPGLPVPRRALCSVSCVLSLTLYFDCSLCRDTFRKGACCRFPSCSSRSGVFHAKSRVKAEDGSGEVLLYVQDEAVSLILGVSPNLWEALKSQILSRGRLVVKNRGKNYEIMSEEQSEDPLRSYLIFLMSRSHVCRPLMLTFTQRVTMSLPDEPSNMTRFTRGERDYITRILPSQTLTCLRLEEVEPRALCHLIRERNHAT
uniref:CST complex subunit CTC1 n=1 Tax=Leptobrachium leishanense TaxID=445787 RepID=A0A8C5MIH5_9ANUR